MLGGATSSAGRLASACSGSGSSTALVTRLGTSRARDMHSLHSLHSAYSCRLFKEINKVVKQDREVGRSAVGSQYSCRQREFTYEGEYEITIIKKP